jgi:hypothetical protein
MPLVGRFETSFGAELDRDVLLVRVATPDGEGWGECVAPSDPLYSSEYADGAQHVIEHHLLPRVFALPDATAETAEPAMAAVKGHPMAKAAVEMALLDAELRAQGVPLADFLGAERASVPCGVSVGIQPDVETLLESVAGYLAEGYVRVKLKVAPGWDVDPVRAVRERFGPGLLLQVDANCGYREADIPRLLELDAFDLLLSSSRSRGRPRLAHRARAPGEHADLPGRDDHVGARGAPRDRSRRLLRRQHQAGPRRRAARGAPDPRPVRRRGSARLVRRDARDGHRAGRQRRLRRAAELQVAGRHVSIEPILGARSRDAAPRARAGQPARPARRRARHRDRRRAAGRGDDVRRLVPRRLTPRRRRAG